MKKDVVRGVVLRAVDVKNSDRMLTVYTHERGIMSIYARGAKRMDGKSGTSSTAEFAYSEFTVVQKQDKLWSSEISNIRFFDCGMMNFEGYSLNFYVLELFEHIATAEPDADLMRLLLNTLYASSERKNDHRLIKAAFEIRLLSHIGYMPDVTGCSECEARGRELYFDVVTGSLKCAECTALGAEDTDTEPHQTVIITEGARAALEYSIGCPLEKLFSFTLVGEDLDCFSRAAESYLVRQLDRDFAGLDYIHNVDLPKKPK